MLVIILTNWLTRLPYKMIMESHIAVVVLLPWCLRCWTRVPGNIMPSSVLRKNRRGELMPIARLQMNWVWLILHILLL